MKGFNAPKGGNAVLTRKRKDREAARKEVSMPRRAVMLF